MKKWQKRNCDFCGKYYESQAKYYCSISCKSQCPNGRRISPEKELERRRKIREAQRGKVFSPETREAIRRSKLGKPRSEECRRKMSLGMMGKTPWNKGKTGLQKAWNKGKSNWWCKGDKNNNWKGGITPINKAFRETPQYKDWRTKVFTRDDWTCRNCGQRGGELHADHIKPFSLYVELRLDLGNGRTLCEPCHYKIGWQLFREANPRKKNKPLILPANKAGSGRGLDQAA